MPRKKDKSLARRNLQQPASRNISQPQIATIEPASNQPRAVALRAERTTFFSGPLPTPEIIAGYEHILPGAAERVFKMTEKEQEHRHASDRFAQQQLAIQSADDATITKRGQAAGLIVAVTGLIVAGLVTALHHPATGAIIGSVDLVTLVTAFLYGSAKKPTEQVRIAPNNNNKIESGQSKPALPAARPNNSEKSAGNDKV